ncbi:Golgin family A protein [Citrus sinensis]|uniref:Golgin family A protein n=1 Tax=Citrus sinensis TaxID=2711 RepID=A0ACB8P1J4_CITSI|nr:Golgin family A protein [Citrus sinensis]
MEGVGSRMGRASARYGPTQTVFNGPVRKWKKRWVHVLSSSPSTISQSNGHNNNNNSNSINGAPLLLCKWTPLSSNSSDNNGATTEEPPKRRFRYTPVAVLEEQKKAGLEKDGDEAREIETDMLNGHPNSETNEVKDLNMSDWEVGLCLGGRSDDQDSVSHIKDNQLIKSAIDDLF